MGDQDHISSLQLNWIMCKSLPYDTSFEGTEGIMESRGGLALCGSVGVPGDRPGEDIGKGTALVMVETQD